MARGSRYEGCRVALLTQHGKQAVIAPLLEPALGCHIELVTGFDTDQLGTFTRETPRPGTQQEAARRKARQGMLLAGASLGIASEGSFAADPFSGMLPWNVELVTWIDDELGIEITGIAQGADRRGHILSGSWPDIATFAEREGFPAHYLVLRPDNQDDPRIHKSIQDWERLRTCFDDCLAASNSGQVFVERDLRAHANPTRMQRIAEATADLLQRLQSECPACATPGFWISERLTGLPCAICRLPTALAHSEIWACLRCDHKASRPLPDRVEADPAHCAYCNP
jgi:hypothetical protein